MEPGRRPPQDSPFAYEAPNDARAVLSLVLGLLSLVTCGLTGLPAVALGFSAKGAIQRAGGMLRGEGIANGGIATGIAGTAIGLFAIAAMLAGLVAGARSTASHPPPPPAPYATAPGATSAPASTAPEEERAPITTPATIGTVRLVDLDPRAKRSFRQQLSAEYAQAKAAHQVVILMTDEDPCSVCREFEAALTDTRMQSALANVDLVRVDIDAFRDELRAADMLEPTLPWFYKLDSTLRPVDAISAGEWDDNVPENMAPVLKSFVGGTLKTRRERSQVGTPL
jgi:hypothetical protein